MQLKARIQLLLPKQVRAHVYTIFADDIGVTVVIYSPERSVLYGAFNDIGLLSLLHRQGGEASSLQGDGHGLCAQVYSTPGGQIGGCGLQHCHQLCRQRLSQGKHALSMEFKRGQSQQDLAHESLWLVAISTTFVKQIKLDVSLDLNQFFCLVFSSPRLSGWKTKWSLERIQSTWCRTTRECWP